ncbi:Contig_80, whole genome shotgun sequence [Aeromonas veronii]|uniref:Contig_80, whole genome shotgun sequence n=1 Tax=Aeromonas veronii TaxID=654 RepID=A0A653KZ78_AERVE|nr:hypothetical protein [Aeromonas veronii]VXA84038.1 Contig_80, whole genome shotgun sequence [Aeromonas veronii]
MTTSNIEQFDMIAGKTFAALYQAFPMPIDIALEEYTVHGSASEDRGDGIEAMTEEASLIMASWSWLVEADYIDANVQDDIGLKEAVLSAKGLSILKSMPSPFTTPIGERLISAIQENHEYNIKTLASMALSVGINALK